MHGQFNIPGLGHPHNMGGPPPMGQGHMGPGHLGGQGHLGGVGHIGVSNQTFSPLPHQQFMGNL